MNTSQLEIASQNLVVEVTPEENLKLKFIEDFTGISRQQIIEDFIADLCGSARNAGSDERRLAFDWFKRRSYAIDPVSGQDAIDWMASEGEI